MTCGGFIYSGLTDTRPNLFETGLGPELAGSYTQIGLYVGAITGAASLSSLLGGWLADRYSPRQVYLAFWLLSVLRNVGMSRSINSKYDDNAGVVWLAL